MRKAVGNELFELIYEKYKITKPIRLIELFGGIGCQFQALKNIGANVESWVYCDFDKYACKGFNAIRGTNYEPSDITKLVAKDLKIIDRDKYEYILTYSYPCQDLSISGRQEGMKKGSSTKSSLLWEVERILEECGKELPQVLLLENVVECHSDANKQDFLVWVSKLEKLGYRNWLEDLNSKHYNAPQSRERTYMVSILGEYYYQFPNEEPLKVCTRDILENEVNDKYYIDINKLKNKNYEQSRRVYHIDGISPTIHTCGGGDREPKIFIPFGTYYTWKNKQGEINTQCNRAMDINGVSLTVPTLSGHLKIVTDYENGIVRKLTPRECMRLMGWKDEQIDKQEEVVSKTQCYKQAGNGIVIQVLEKIFSNLIVDKNND